MNLRPARLADAAAIAAVEAVSTPVPWTETQVATSLSAQAGWVLEVDGRIVGHLLASAQGPEGEILAVAVLPDYRRHGGARKLLAAADAFWRERGVEQAFLEVRAGNDPAQALYASEGWTRTGTRLAYYRDGTDAIVLKKSVRIT